MGPGTFDPAAWALKRRLVSNPVQHRDRVGYRHGLPLTYGYLYEPARLQISADVAVA